MPQPEREQSGKAKSKYQVIPNLEITAFSIQHSDLMVHPCIRASKQNKKNGLFAATFVLSFRSQLNFEHTMFVK